MLGLRSKPFETDNQMSCWYAFACKSIQDETQRARLYKGEYRRILLFGAWLYVADAEPYADDALCEKILDFSLTQNLDNL